MEPNETTTFSRLSAWYRKPSHSTCVAEARSLAEIAGVELQPEQLRFPLRKEILEAAVELADVSDVVGLERSLVERLVRVVIAMDRAK